MELILQELRGFRQENKEHVGTIKEEIVRKISKGELREQKKGYKTQKKSSRLC